MYHKDAPTGLFVTKRIMDLAECAVRPTLMYVPCGIVRVVNVFEP